MVVPPSAPIRPELSTPFEMAFGPSVRQRRVTVFFRPLLVIPQVIVLYFVGIAAFVVVFLGWFAALFTGRLPDSFARFILGYLRWRAWVESYGFLLTDQYPPFSMESSPDYPVDAAVQTGRLNRWAVLFRYFIAIPAGIAVALLYFGLMIFWIVTWAAALIKGELPRSLYEANAAALRYGYRYAAYYFMLTSFYPSEVMGDDAGSGPAFSPVGPPPPASVPPAVPMAGPEGTGIRAPAPPPAAPIPVPSAPPPTLPSTPPPPFPAPGTDPTLLPPVVVPPSPPPGGILAPVPAYPGAGPDLTPPSPNRWRLVLSAGARKLVVTYFIVGALGFVAYVGVLVAITSGTVTVTSQAITSQNQLITAYNLLGRQSQAFGTAGRACSSSSGAAGTECLAAADSQLATDLLTYQNTVSTIDFPFSVASQVSAVASAAGAASTKLEQLAQLGSDPQAYASAANSAGLDTAVQQVDSTTRSLNSALLAL